MVESGKDQYIEQKITQQVTVASAATGTVSVTVPTNGKAFLKGYGYTWFTSNVYRLTAGSRQLPTRTDQEGSTSIPVLYGNPYPANSGETFELSITNNDTASHTYDVVMYVVTNRIIETNSVGGELILTTGAGGGAVTGAVAIYDSTITTSAGVTAKGLAVDPQSPTTLLCGSKTASTTASALASTTAIKKVTIQVASGSPSVYIGNATSQTIVLVATQSIEIEIDDIAKVFVKKVSTDATLHYIAS